MKATFSSVFHLSQLGFILVCSNSFLLAQNEGEGAGFGPPEDAALNAPLITEGGQYTKAGWPPEFVKRPLTLAKGMIEIGNKEITSKKFDFDGVAIAPGVNFGVSDKIQLGLSNNSGVGAFYSINKKIDVGISVDFIKDFTAPTTINQLIFPVNFRILSNTSLSKKSAVNGFSMFVRGSSFISVSRDSGTTWQTDSVGSLGGYPYDLALDTSNYLYYANSKGLFKHHTDTLMWNKISTFPASNASSIFVDRNNRLFASSFSKTYMSTDGGTTWKLDTAGVYGFTASKFCDDAFGNIYALSNNKLYRSLGGTQPWSRIDQPISSLAVDQNIYSLFNSISADSIVVTATAFGVFSSSDQGTSWSPMKTGLRAGPIYGLVKTADGKLLTSTNLGIYSHTAGGGPWSKIYPSIGYIAGRPIYQDASNNLYTLGAKTDYNDLYSFWMNLKSTDGGSTWNADTAGLGSFRKSSNYAYYVDETGTQHYMMSDSVVPLYSKPIGQAWAPDTIGFSKKGLPLSTAFGSNRHGNFYAATNNLTTYKGMLWKRPINGGTWTTDTIGLHGEQIYSLTVDKNGNLFAGTYNGIYFRNNGTWSKIPYPTGLEGNNTFVVTVDSSGALLAGFSTFSGYNAVWHGVYATTNNGSSWNYIGLDSISIRQLVSYGDTTYAVTYAKGIFKFTRFGVTGVEKQANKTPNAFALEQNFPNPFNPTTTINYQLPFSAIATLKVYDLLGREVATLLNEKKDAGKYQIEFNASRFASGVYFYRLQTGNYISTKKLILLK